MAKQVVLVDDLDGSRADESVLFALDGREYEIDLSATNAQDFRKAFEKYVQAGRPTGTQGRRRRPGPARDYDIKTLRRWAEANDIELPQRGRIPADIVERFKGEAEQPS